MSDVWVNKHGVIDGLMYVCVKQSSSYFHPEYKGDPSVVDPGFLKGVDTPVLPRLAESQALADNS